MTVGTESRVALRTCQRVGVDNGSQSVEKGSGQGSLRASSQYLMQNSVKRLSCQGTVGVNFLTRCDKEEKKVGGVKIRREVERKSPRRFFFIVFFNLLFLNFLLYIVGRVFCRQP